MYKLMHNNMVVDLLENLHYVRYMKRSQRWIQTDSQSANGIMGSDNNTIYLLRGRVCSCPDELKEVEIYKITQEEYETLSVQFSIQRQENESLRAELKNLRTQMSEQNALLQQILSKL